MYLCEEFCFFLGSVSFLFLSLCSVVHYARDCSCMIAMAPSILQACHL